MEDNFIVRIYRHGESAPDAGQDAGEGVEIVGLVESVETGRRSSFRTIRELWEILSRESTDARRSSDSRDTG